MKRIKITLSLAALIAGLAAWPPSTLAQTGHRQGRFVERLDQDGDGRVSPAEFDGPAEHFSHRDRDGDGYLSEDEAPQGPPGGGGQGGERGQGGAAFVERLDRDGDGRVSQEEFDGPPEHFSDFDQDGDGYLSADEAPHGPPRGGRRRPARE